MACIVLWIENVLMRDEEGRKKEASKVKQHSTPKVVIFPKKNELPRVGFEPKTLHTLDRALYQLSYRGNSSGWAQILHLTCTVYMYMYTERICMYLCMRLLGGRR